MTVLAEKIDNKRLNSPDDLVIDSKGRIYFTDPRFGARYPHITLPLTADRFINISASCHRDDMDMVTEGVYRIDVDEYQGTPRPWLACSECN